MRKKIFFIFIFIFLSFIISFFQNCSGFDVGSIGETTNSVLGCETIPYNDFKKTIYTYFSKSRCADCHSENTTHPFTSSNIVLAFNTFEGLGVDRIDQKLSAGHQGIDYSAHKPKLDEFKIQRIETLAAKQACEDNDNQDGSDIEEQFDGYLTTAETVNLFSTTQSKLCRLDYHLEEDAVEPVTLTWDLSDKIEGAIIKLDLVFQTNEFQCPPGAEDYCEDSFYCVSQIYILNPRITTIDHDIQVKSLRVFVENNNFSLTTFSHINTEVKKSSTDFELSPGGSAGQIDANGDILFSNETKWQLKFDVLQIKDTL